MVETGMLTRMADVRGSYDRSFVAVPEALSVSLDEFGGGASVAVFVGGEPVVDVWGGFTDAGRSVPWQRDTITNVWSVTKTVTALAGLMMIDRGLISRGFSKCRRCHRLLLRPPSRARSGPMRNSRPCGMSVTYKLPCASKHGPSRSIERVAIWCLFRRNARLTLESVVPPIARFSIRDAINASRAAIG